MFFYSSNKVVCHTDIQYGSRISHYIYSKGSLWHPEIISERFRRSPTSGDRLCRNDTECNLTYELISKFNIFFYRVGLSGEGFELYGYLFAFNTAVEGNRVAAAYAMGYIFYRETLIACPALNMGIVEPESEIGVVTFPAPVKEGLWLAVNLYYKKLERRALKLCLVKNRFLFYEVLDINRYTLFSVSDNNKVFCSGAGCRE